MFDLFYLFRRESFVGHLNLIWFYLLSFQMVLPTVLKKKHTLRDINMLPVVKRIRSGKPDSLKEFARVSKDIRTESLDYEEIDGHVSSLTGESVGEVLMMAGRNDKSVDEARWAIHCIILYANEFGQPRGQNLTQSNEVSKFM